MIDKKIGIILGSFLLSYSVINYALSSPSNLNEDPVIKYFDQDFPTDHAVRFAPGIVSTKSHEHSRIEFSPDGKGIYWSVFPVPFGSSSPVIRYSEYLDGSWTMPMTISFSGKYRDASPSFREDNNTLYFDSWRPKTKGGEVNKLGGIWRSKRIDGEWNEPEFFLSQNRDDRGSSTIIFTSKKLFMDAGKPTSEGVQSWKIRYSNFVNGVYTKPVTMGPEINTTAINWTPYIDKAESLMIFSSHYREDEHYKGDGDLYISFKDQQGNWTGAINMGDKVNTPAQERFASLSPDGKYLFFARHTDENYSDIFWIDSAFINELRDQVLKRPSFEIK